MPFRELKMLKQIGETLWSWEQPVKMGLGITFPTRSVVARLSDGGLVVHAPLRLDDETAAEIEALGRVRHVIAPNVFHHLYFGHASERWPDATTHAARGLARKRPDLRIDSVLGEGPAPAFAEEFVPVEIGGTAVRETVFVARASGTLVVTDLVFNIHETENWVSSLFFGLLGVRGKASQSPLYRLATKDRARAGAACASLLEADWDRLVMSHGEIVEGDAKAELSRGARWMLGGASLAQSGA